MVGVCTVRILELRILPLLRADLFTEAVEFLPLFLVEEDNVPVDLKGKRRN